MTNEVFIIIISVIVALTVVSIVLFHIARDLYLENKELKSSIASIKKHLLEIQEQQKEISLITDKIYKHNQ